jgi:hypothetical protein
LGCQKREIPKLAGRAGHPPARRGPFLPSSSGIKARAELSAPKNLHAKNLFDFFLLRTYNYAVLVVTKSLTAVSDLGIGLLIFVIIHKHRSCEANELPAKLKCNFTDSRSRPLWTRAKIQSSTDPLSECVCFCRLRAPRALKLLIRNFTGEKFFLV